MDGFKELYFALFNDVDAVIDEFDKNPIYEPVVQKLKQVELQAEDRYISRPWDEDEVTKDDDKL